jgi:hypothetical protein
MPEGDIEARRQWILDNEEAIEEARTPTEIAQDIMYDAWIEGSPDEIAKAARAALDVSPSCADAYDALAMHDADSPEEQLRLYRLGIEAGERAFPGVRAGDQSDH